MPCKAMALKLSLVEGYAELYIEVLLEVRCAVVS